MAHREYDLRRPVHTTSVAGYYITRIFWLAVLGAVALIVWSYQPQIRSAFESGTKAPVAKKKTHQQREADALRSEESSRSGRSRRN